jgi:hypothetical protein
MKLPFKLPSIDSSNIASAILGAVAAMLLFAGFTAFMLSIMPFLFGIVLIAGLLVWLNKPTVEDNDVD